jgi:hypothetical protein
MFSRLMLATGLVIGLSASLEAQQFNPRQLQQHGGRQPGMAGVPANIEGTVQGVAPGCIVVMDGNNQAWRVMVPRMAKVQVTGSATADFVQPGLFVEFKADIDERGTPKEKVGELTIVSLSPERFPGLFPADSDAKGGEEKGGFGVGEAAERGAKGGGKAAKRAGKGAAAGAVAAGSYRIVGKLMSGRGGKLAVNTGRGTIPLELTEQPTVAVDFADYTVVSKGDKISVKGMAPPGRVGMAQATEVKIELSEPLAGGVKKKGSAAKAEAKKPSKRAKKTEGLPEPADEK